jgi:hypothetical protein
MCTPSMHADCLTERAVLTYMHICNIPCTTTGAIAACLFGCKQLPFAKLMLPQPLRKMFGYLGPLIESEDPREAQRKKVTDMVNQLN